MSQDFQTWSGLELKHNIKKTEFLFEGGVRLADNSSIISKYFSEFVVKNSYNELVSYSFGYRYILQKNNELVFENNNRFYADISFKKSISKRIKLNFRTRIQSQTDVQFSFAQNMINKTRQKLKCTYDFKNTNLDTFLALEVFYILQDEFEKIRYVCGVEKPFGKQIDLGFDFMFQKELSVKSPDSIFAFRTKLSYRI